MCYENGIVYVRDLMFESDKKQSYDLYRQKGLKIDFLTWTGLRLSVPKELRSFELLSEMDSVNFKHNNLQVIYEMFPATPNVSGFITQLVRASHRYREVMGSNPVEVLFFLGFSTQLLKLRS